MNLNEDKSYAVILWQLESLSTALGVVFRVIQAAFHDFIKVTSIDVFDRSVQGAAAAVQQRASLSHVVTVLA
jgi:hypothetical protein